jgi:hypothetical protein
MEVFMQEFNPGIDYTYVEEKQNTSQQNTSQQNQNNIIESQRIEADICLYELSNSNSTGNFY